MKRTIFFIILFAAAVGWTTWQFLASQNEKAVSVNIGTESDELGLAVGMIAPDFEAVSLSGEKVKLSDYRGKKVFLNFWATWCPPCRDEMPDMQKLYETRDDVEILAVNLTGKENNIESVKNFVNEHNLTFPILTDENLALAHAFEVKAYPTSYLIDSNGKIQSVILGSMEYDLMNEKFENMD